MPLFETIEKSPEAKREDEMLEECMGGPWDKNYAEQLGIKKKEKEIKLENPMKGMGGEKMPPKADKTKKEAADFSNPLSEVKEEEIEDLINGAFFSKNKTG